jgi:hypothetical protein
VNNSRLYFLYDRLLTGPCVVAIHSVSIGKQDVEFAHQDNVTELQLSGATETEVWDCHRHLELRRKLYSALQEGDEGELAIAIPKEWVYQTTSEGAVLRKSTFNFMFLTQTFYLLRRQHLWNADTWRVRI